MAGSAVGEQPTIRVRRVEGAPVVAVRLWLRGGSRIESRPGEALVSGRMLTEGTDDRDWREIATAAEGRGISLAAFGELEVRGLAVDGLAADWELAVDWALEMGLGSAFPADRCVWVARQAAGELAALMDQPDARTGLAFLDQLYHPHPAGRPPHGDAESLAAIDSRGCAEFHRRSVDAGLIVSVAGLVDARAVRARILDRLGGFAGSPTEPPAPPEPRGDQERRNPSIEGDQAHVFLGRLTVPRRHPALPALELLAVVLGAGAGLAGRIPLRVREREGLAYSAQVETAAGAGLDPGRFVVYVGTSVESVDRAIACVAEELERLLDEGPSEREVEEARAYLLGREPFRRETARQWASLMAAAAHYDLPLDRPEWVVERLKEVSREDVERVAREYLRPDDLRVTVGTPRRR